jgi:hypothetical protein
MRLRLYGAGVRRLFVALIAGGALSGCALIDQTTFAPSPEPKAASAATPVVSAPVDPRAPLVTIRYDVPNPQYRDLLAYALKQAAARRPDSDFDVVASVPATGPVADQITAASRAAATQAADVAHTMVSLGIAATRIHLGARPVPGQTATEVRVYVR